MNKILVASVAALILAFLYPRSDKPIVGKVVKINTGGRIQGIISKSRDGRDFYSWRGIPFAEPPVGELRYASPKPAKPWDGVRDGSEHGSACTQLLFGMTLELGGSEDCLYLDVYAPKLDEAKMSKLPVMVWIHGGGFDFGAASEFGPEYFMDEDVVVVMTNYRVSSFGFLSTGDEHVRGNMGLKDQALALKWVKENVDDFGGDSKKVTIFGESAGAGSVHFQTLSPTTKGLFQKAIAQSGSAGPSWSINTVEDARKHTLKFARQVGCGTEDSAELVKCLRSKSIDELMQPAFYNMENFYAIRPQKDGINSRPCIEAVKDEEAFLTEHPLDILAAGKAHRIPLMVGAVSHDGLLASGELLKNDDYLAEFESNWTANIARSFGIPETSKKVQEITTKIRNYYTPNWEQLSKEDRRVAYTNLLTDSLFNLHMHHAVSVQRNYSSVYPYYYSRRGGPSWAPFVVGITGKWPVSVEAGIFMSQMTFYKIFGWKMPDYGVAHGDDLPILFLMPGPLEIPKNDQDPDYVFSKQVVKLWVDFARDEASMEFRGVPFKATSKTGPVQYFEITENPKTISAPFEDRVKFLESLNLLKPRLLE